MYALTPPTDPIEVFRMLNAMTHETPAATYFLSILQHMLLIRDDYFIRYERAGEGGVSGRYVHMYVCVYEELSTLL